MAGEALLLVALSQALLYSLACEICFHTGVANAYSLSLLRIPCLSELSLQKEIPQEF